MTITRGDKQLSDTELASDIQDLISNSGDVAAPSLANDDDVIDKGGDDREGQIDDIADRLENVIEMGDDDPNNDLLSDDEESDTRAFDEITQDIFKGQKITQEQNERLTKEGRDIFENKMFLDERYNSVDWMALRQQDPAEYAALKNDFNMAYNNNQQRMQSLAGVSEELNRRSHVAADQYMEEQNNQLLNAIPAWRDNEIRDKETRLVKQFLKDEYGLTHEEIENIDDFRTIKMARDSLRNQQRAEKKSPKQKRFRVPRQPKKKAVHDNNTSSPGSSESIAARLKGRV